MDIIDFCLNKGIKITKQRKVIINVISDSNDHPDIEEIYNRAKNMDSDISITTVYRTINLLKQHEIVNEHDFGDNRSRYEVHKEDDIHHHIIDVDSGNIIEFNFQHEDELKKIANKLGYDLVDYKLELYVRKK